MNKKVIFQTILIFSALIIATSTLLFYVFNASAEFAICFSFVLCFISLACAGTYD